MNFKTENIEKLDGFAAGWNMHRCNDSLSSVMYMERQSAKDTERTGGVYAFGAKIEGWKARDKRVNGEKLDIGAGRCYKCHSRTHLTNEIGELWDCGCKKI